MKKLLIPAFAAALLLAACNTTEEAPKEEEQASSSTEQTGTTQNGSSVATENDSTTEGTVTEQPDEVDTLTEVKVYGPDANVENVVLIDTIQHSFQKDGPLTPFILDKLGLTEYYNEHTVSGDEKTIMIDFKESLLNSNLVQGSAGGWIFAGQLYASFFETLPTLENMELRVGGKEVELDHISFVGTVKRADYEEVYKQ